MNNEKESDLFLDIIIEEFLKQQVFPEFQNPESVQTYKLLGSPKVYVYSDKITLTKIQIYLMLNYPEKCYYILDYLEIRPRESFLLEDLNINPNSLLFITYPENINQDEERRNRFAINYAKVSHDLCCQGTLIRTT